MGGRDNRKLVTFRANDDELAAIEQLVKASGMSKQDYLLRAALSAIAHTPLPNADSSIKSSPHSDLKLLAADGSSQKSASTVIQFEKGQEITKQSNKTYDLLWRSFEASQKVGKVEYHLSNKLGTICKVVGLSRSRCKKLLVWVVFDPSDPVFIREDGTFLTLRNDGVEYHHQSEIVANPDLASTKSLVTISGDKAFDTSMECPPKRLVGGTEYRKVLWHDGWLWQQNKDRSITQLFEYPQAKFDAMDVATNKTIDQLRAELEAVEAATSAVESTNDETPVEAVEAPSTPVNEELTEQDDEARQSKVMTKQQFRKKNGFANDKAGNEAYGKACMKGRAKGWVDVDGVRWFTTDDSKDGRWSTSKVDVRSLKPEQLSLAV